MSVFGLSILYRKILKEKGKPDVMHAHFAGVGHTASKLKRKTGLPFVITEHTSSMMKPTIDQHLYKTANEAYASADALIAVSPGLREVIKGRFDKDAIYIPNIVDTKLFSYVPKSSDDIFRFISIGGLIVRKRMDLTIEAFAQAFGDNEKVTLTIFGEGPERGKLEDLIKKHKLAKRVNLMGLQSRKDIAKHLQTSDCFVLASQAETFGVVYTEALSAGVPVIATRCGGPEHFVNDGNGVFVHVDDLNALVKAMRYMYNNAQKYDRQAIANSTIEQFSASAVVSQLNQVYKKIII
jgi:glycosyltransferase involved in cell wall biosynthesis